MSSLNNVNQLIYYNNQQRVVEQYFTNIAAIQNKGVLCDKFDSTKSVAEYYMSKYHNAGIWSMD